ncbi:MAG TPA: TIGR03557 family F420-dependent LLM class oxidoreductase [Candidatus Binatia bacterium]|nr:TIGR03557 family F420-dependent LLM class oxidoreductase [Candidatus Binatia bacterium]
MARLGYSLSSEEHRPDALVRWARMAEEAGFEFAGISDHFHPWIDRQGQSPFVWSVIGAISQATHRLEIVTGVTCPTIRMHPAIVAQAAATSAALLPGRFALGVGSGENLNEHVTGEPWPNPSERLEMLEEAIAVIRALWSGDVTTHRGTHYRVEEARLYTLPDAPPPIYVAASGKKSVDLAGRVGDGLISTSPKREIAAGFQEAGGRGKPRIGQQTVCWAETEAEARRVAHAWWPTAALGGGLNQEIKTPALFEAAAKTVREEDVAESIVCGPDAGRHVQGILEFVDAGFDWVYVHQVGADQEGFLRFYEKSVLPKL